MPVSRANNNDPDAPLARYFVIHDTSGPNYGHRSFPEDVDGGSKINNLAEFTCSDGWGKAHVVINRSGSMLLNHELSIPWRETKFEQAANFAGALKGLFLHVELIQPRRAAAGHRNNAASPTPAFTTHNMTGWRWSTWPPASAPAVGSSLLFTRLWTPIFLTATTTR